MLLVLFILLVLFANTESSPKNLVSHLPRCYVDDAKINDCLINATMYLKPYLSSGIEELGIPSYDPLVISSINIVANNSNLINVTCNVWNFTIHGLNNYNFENIKYDPQTKTFRGKIKFDPISIDTDYYMKGRILFVPVRGEGFAQYALCPVQAAFKITGKITKTKKLEYYVSDSVKIKLNIDDISIHLGGLFDGNLEESMLTNELLNSNSKMVIDAATPIYETIAEAFVMRYITWLTNKYPFYDLFPRSQ